MRYSLILSLIAVAGVIALPVSKMGLDSQARVEGKLEVREPQVSSWLEGVSFSPQNCCITNRWTSVKIRLYILPESVLCGDKQIC